MKKEISFYVLDRNEHMTAELSTAKTGKHTPVLTTTVSEKLDSYDVLTMTIPADDENAGKLREDYTIIFEDIKGWREYIVTNIEENDGETMETTITAELSSIELLDEPLTVTNTSGSADPELVLESVLSGTRWSVGTVDERIYNQTFTENIQYKNVLEVLDMISSAYSCEVSFSYTVGAKGITGRYVNLYKQIGQDRGKWFEIDKDVREITRTIDTADIKTAVIPYGTEPEEAEEGQEQGERLTIKDVVWSVANGDPVDKPAGQEYIGDPDALEQWGKLGNDGTRRHRYLLLEIDAETPEKIAQMAWVSLGRYTKPKVTYEADVLDLYTLSGDEDLLHEHVNLGDSAVIIDRYFTVPIMIKTRIVEQERDLLDPLNNEIVLGDSKETFSVGDVSAEVEELKNKVSKVSYKASYAQLTGNGVHSYAGSEQPADPNKGDLWYQPHPTVMGAFIYSRYNGTSWVEIFDTSDVEQVRDTAQKASNDANTAVEKANAVDEKAQDAIEKAQTAETTASNTADDFNIYREETDTALKSKVESTEFVSYKQQTDKAISESVSSEEFSTYKTQTDTLISSKVATEDYSNDITQIENNINLRVAKGDVVNQINISDESILIDGTKLHITSDSYIDKAVITSAMIKGLTADKITAGEIDANVVNIINLHADNITGGDLNMRNVRIMNGPTPVMTVSGSTNEVELNISKLTINAIDVAEEIADTKQAVTQAEKDAKAHADSVAGTAESNAKSHADRVAQAKADLAEKEAKAHADDVVTKEEQRAIQDAKNKLEEAKSHADSVADTAEKSAKDHADKVVEDLEIGGANLLRDTSGSYRDKTVGLWYSTIDEGSRMSLASLGVKKGDRLTFSLVIKGEDYGGKVRITCWSDENGNGKKTFAGNLVSAGTEGRSAVTFTVPSDSEYIEFAIQNEKPGDVDGYTVEYKEAKVERGSKATGWSAAGDDWESAMSNKADAETAQDIASDLADFKTVTASKEELGEVLTALNNYIADVEAAEDDAVETIEDVETLLDRYPAISTYLGEFTEDWDFLDTYMRMGNEGFIIGEKGSSTAIKISEDRIDFLDGAGKPVAFITNQLMQINRGIFVESATIGEHKIETVGDGITTFTWVERPEEE